MITGRGLKAAGRYKRFRDLYCVIEVGYDQIVFGICFSIFIFIWYLVFGLYCVIEMGHDYIVFGISFSILICICYLVFDLSCVIEVGYDQIVFDLILYLNSTS